jgi:hypothetical protein
VKRFERIAGRVEHVVLVAAIVGTIAFLGLRAFRGARSRRDD